MAAWNAQKVLREGSHMDVFHVDVPDMGHEFLFLNSFEEMAQHVYD